MVEIVFNKARKRSKYKYRRKKPLTGREWRMFDKCQSGFYKNDLRKNRVRFLTLTSSPLATYGLTTDEKFSMLTRDFMTLKNRYENHFSSYVDKRDGKIKFGKEFEYEVRYNKKGGRYLVYPNRGKKVISKKFGDYFKVSTTEGYGVIHIVYSGDYIPRDWLSKNWNEIHGSFIVDIRYPRGDSFKATMYVISQYVAGQNFDKKFGYSKNWVYSGFGKDMDRLKDACRVTECKYVNDWGIECFPVDYEKFRKFWRRWLDFRECYDGKFEFEEWLMIKIDEGVDLVDDDLVFPDE